MNTKPTPQLTGPAACLMLILCLGAFHALRYWTNVDDAFIAFRYAENLADGLGPVFNAGEQVEGYTDFLWVVVLALVHRLGIDVPTAAQHLGLVFSIASMALLYVGGRRFAKLNAWEALLPCAVTAASAPVAMWTGGGLETSMFMLTVTGAGLVYLYALKTGSRFLLTGFVFGLTYLTRPEGFGLFAAAIGLGFLLRAMGWRQAVLFGTGFALLFLPHFLFRLLYYGYPLPNTFYAKTGFSLALLQDGLEYSARYLLSHSAWLLVLVLFAVRPLSSILSKGLLVLAGLFAAITVYILYVGGDIYPYSRFFAPYTPILALLCITGAVRLSRRFKKSGAAPGRLSAIVPLAVTLVMAVPAKVVPDILFRTMYEEELRKTAPMMEQYGVWLKNNYPPGTWMAVSSLGRIPYYAELPTIDMLGLADEHIAHREMELTRGFLGHQKYDSEYILERAPTLVPLEFATPDRDFNPARDLYTEKIFERVQPDRGWWPAPADLIGRRAFREHYVPKAAQIAPGLYFFYFERSDRLISLAESVPPGTTDPGKLFTLAMQYRLQGLYDEAVEALDRAAELDPSSPDLLLNAAFFLHEARRYRAAAERFVRIREIFPTELRAIYGLGLSFHKAGQFKEALPWWNMYLAHAVPGDPFLPKAEKFLQQAKQHAH